MITHVFLPHKLPENSETDEESKEQNAHLASTVTKSLANYKRYAGAREESQINRSLKMLQRHERLESEGFTTSAIATEIEQMRNEGERHDAACWLGDLLT